MPGRFHVAPMERRTVDRRIVNRRVEADARRVVSGLRMAGWAALALLGCTEKYNPPTAPDVPVRVIDAGLPDVPTSVVDVGITEVGVEAQIADATGAPPGRIFNVGTYAGALRINQTVQISFNLPVELKELFGKVSYWGILGPRVDSEGRTPFELINFVIDPKTGAVTAGVKPLPGAYSEGERNLWHLVAEVGEGEEISYCAYGLPIADEVSERPDAGHRREDAGHRRDDAGQPPPEDAGAPRDVVETGEARIRIRP